MRYIRALPHEIAQGSFILNLKNLSHSYRTANKAYFYMFNFQMPRIWICYCEVMIKRGLITETRRVFDRALRSLPVTQHTRIWPMYIDFLTSHDLPDTTIRVYRRYLKMNPKVREDYIEYLIERDQIDEAAKELTVLVNQDQNVSEKGRTSHQLWTQLCDLISKNPVKIFSLNVDAIIRQGIYRYTDQVGFLWCSLADYYIRSAEFERVSFKKLT